MSVENLKKKKSSKMVNILYHQVDKIKEKFKSKPKVYKIVN